MEKNKTYYMSCMKGLNPRLHGYQSCPSSRRFLAGAPSASASRRCRPGGLLMDRSPPEPMPHSDTVVTHRNAKRVT